MRVHRQGRPRGCLVTGEGRSPGRPSQICLGATSKNVAILTGHSFGPMAGSDQSAEKPGSLAPPSRPSGVLDTGLRSPGSGDAHSRGHSHHRLNLGSEKDLRSCLSWSRPFLSSSAGSACGSLLRLSPNPWVHPHWYMTCLMV